jgi:hypothetical protein
LAYAPNAPSSSNGEKKRSFQKERKKEGISLPKVIPYLAVGIRQVKW